MEWVSLSDKVVLAYAVAAFQPGHENKVGERRGDG